MNLLKQRLAERRRSFGLWLELGSAAAAEAAVYAGFKLVLIDNEHGPASLETTVHMMRAVEAAGGEVIVRVPANDPVYIKRLLELGARSLLIPQVDTPGQAEQAVAACRYPPLGRRGFAAPIVRASRYGMDGDYAATAHDHTCVMIQVESEAAVNDIDRIVAVEGVDLVFVGPNDLAGSVGKLGQLDDPAVDQLIRRVEQAAKRHNVALGNIPLPNASAQDLFERGYTLVLGASDIGLLMQGLRDAAGQFHAGELG